MAIKCEILTSPSASALAEEVQTRLNDGWELQGPLVMTIDPAFLDSAYQYAQMMLYDTERHL